MLLFYSYQGYFKKEKIVNVNIHILFELYLGEGEIKVCSGNLSHSAFCTFFFCILYPHLSA